jgi:hypothetical protein
VSRFGQRLASLPSCQHCAGTGVALPAELRTPDAMTPQEELLARLERLAPSRQELVAEAAERLMAAGWHVEPPEGNGGRPHRGGP